jgi:hypothetical protein
MHVSNVGNGTSRDYWSQNGGTCVYKRTGLRARYLMKDRAVLSSENKS